MSSQNPYVKERIIAHRGASGYRPENTLVAIQHARELGALWVEIDVKITADERALIIHDDEVDRTTNGSGFVAAKQFNEVRELDAGSWYAREYTGLQIPTLEETLALILELDLGLQLEIKPTAGDDVETAEIALSTVKSMWPKSNPKLFLSSFSVRSLAAAARVLPDIPRAYAVVVPPRDPVETLRELNCQILHNTISVLSDKQLRLLDQSGVEFAVATVNDSDDACRLIRAGAQTILTDYPDLLTGPVHIPASC